jgi:hypothetical protein
VHYKLSWNGISKYCLKWKKKIVCCSVGVKSSCDMGQNNQEGR